jgi:hypothetical protein
MLMRWLAMRPSRSLSLGESPCHTCVTVSVIQDGRKEAGLISAGV